MAALQTDIICKLIIIIIIIIIISFVSVQTF